MRVDSHVHIVDPARFPVPQGPGYKPTRDDIGTADDLGRISKENGVSRAVIVQLSGYGTDNACVLDAVARSNGAWRAVVALAPDVTDANLDDLHDAGVIGVRFNIKNLGPAVLTAQARLLDAMAERGWVAQIQTPALELPAFATFLAKVRGPLLFDHLGLPDVTSGVSEPGFQQLLSLGRAGAYIKLSGAFRVSRQPFPHSDLDPFTAAILEAFGPQRRVWGSDWPFVGLPSRPSYGDTLAMLQRWLPASDDRRLACIDVPSRLFGFATAP